MYSMSIHYTIVNSSPSHSFTICTLLLLSRARCQQEITADKPIVIEYWTTVFDRTNWGFQDELTSCPQWQDRCTFVDYSVGNVSTADVLLWHMRDIADPPIARLPHQKWGFCLMESPVYSLLSYSQLGMPFNFTVTFKSDADVTWNYGTCRPLSSAIPLRAIGRKKRSVAWFTSNCYPQSKRQVYAHSLAKHIDIDVYGSCEFATHTCGKDVASTCLDHLNSTYRFALAFENSLCDDYVTEKVFSLLSDHVDVIPIVIGRADYSALLPPHSYIDVRDYATPRDLARYLRLLEDDVELYNAYFVWRATYACGGSTPAIGCRICSYLWETRHQLVVADVRKHFSFESNCVTPADFYHAWSQIHRNYLYDASSGYVYIALIVLLSLVMGNVFMRKVLRKYKYVYI